MSTNQPLKYVAAGLAAAVVAIGGYAVGTSGSDSDSSGTASAQAPGMPASADGQAPGMGQAPPGMGTAATGASADKAKAAALAKYDGTVERVMKLGDGSYVVHVLTSSGEQHVAVTKDFKVTGAQQGGPGGGGPGGAPPAGAAPPSGSGSGATS